MEKDKKKTKEFQFDVNNIEIKDLLGNDYLTILEKENKTSLSKLIGNLIYTSTRDLGMFEKAQRIYRSLPVLLNELEKEQFVQTINQVGYATFIQQGIISAIVEIDSQEKEGKII